MYSLSNNLKEDLIKKYNVVGPYYSSYPVLGQWSNNFSFNDYIFGLNELCSEKKTLPLFLYVHFPFCAKQCYFCICNSIVTYDHSATQKYLTHLFREIDLFHDFFEKHSFNPGFKKIHLGGGSPNLMDREEFDLLVAKLKTLVNFRDLDEFTIEVDPRTVNKEKLKYYSEKGINRISLGIQDFDPYVQKAINRIQPLEMIEQLLSPEIRRCFKSINFDILYGLPLQTRESFRRTMEMVKNLSPDRITLIKYAHVPERKPHQRLIGDSDLPDYFEATMIFSEAISSLLGDGYEHIGIDHFAKPSDDLALATRNKTLWRNFIGVTPGGTHNIVGIGPTSTSSINNYYAQNVYSLQEYYKAIGDNNFPILRGFKLKNDDLIRRDVINEIICTSSLSFADIEKKYNIEFNRYFKEEMDLLKDFIKDDMLTFTDHAFKVTPLGRIFIRHICKVFDKYLKSTEVYKISGP